MSANLKIYAPGSRALIAYLGFLSAFVPLSTDLYLPALPRMAEWFQAAPELVNLTLTAFMLLFALSMLLWGPFSDKYGRKPILLCGLLLYTASSVACALAPHIWVLIAGRCVQAVGSGAVCAVALAIVKDAFRGKTMERVLTVIQSITLLAPMVAPVIGGLLLTFTSWRGIFWMLTLCGVISLLGFLPLGESLRHPTQGPALQSLGRIGHVLRHGCFRKLLLLFSLVSMPMMAYLATSAYIFQEHFAVSPQMYSLFFAANGSTAVIAPLLYMRWFHSFSLRPFLGAAFACTGIFGALTLVFGAYGPISFALLFAPVTFLGSVIRPPSTIMLMRQLDGDTGTVASLISCAALLCGSVSMQLASSWSDPLAATAGISLMVGAVCFVGWLALARHSGECVPA